MCRRCSAQWSSASNGRDLYLDFLDYFLLSNYCSTCPQKTATAGTCSQFNLNPSTLVSSPGQWCSDQIPQLRPNTIHLSLCSTPWQKRLRYDKGKWCSSAIHLTSWYKQLYSLLIVYKASRSLAHAYNDQPSQSILISPLHTILQIGQSIFT